LFSPVRALNGGGRLWRPEPIAVVGSIAITVIAFAVVTLIRALPTGRDMRDFGGILDGAYKISQGLIPYVDFAGPHGAWPLYQAIPVLYLLQRVQPLALYQFIGWLSILNLHGIRALAATNQRRRGPFRTEHSSSLSRRSAGRRALLVAVLPSAKAIRLRNSGVAFLRRPVTVGRLLGTGPDRARGYPDGHRGKSEHRQSRFRVVGSVAHRGTSSREAIPGVRACRRCGRIHYGCLTLDLECGVPQPECNYRATSARVQRCCG
jgi:hypothetical protein